MKKAFSLLFLLLLFCTCKKQVDEEDYWSIRYSFFQDDEFVECCWGGPLREETSLLEELSPYKKPERWSSDPSFQSVVSNNSLSEFSFLPCWRWIVYSPFILEDEKYYYDPDQEALYFSYPINHVPGPHYGARLVYSGWASFTTKVDDPEVKLRILFEADCAEREGDPIIHVTNGVFDISKKVSIKGMDRLIP